jgi:hypothetical protein
LRVSPGGGSGGTGEALRRTWPCATGSSGGSEQAAGRQLIPDPSLPAQVFDRGRWGLQRIITSRSVFDRAAEHALALASRSSAGPARDLPATLRGQIAALRAVVLERCTAAERYRADAIPSADQIERIAQVSYDAGERGILELLDAHRVGATARIRQASLDAAVRQAEIELEFVSGWEIP